ncbi:uncharacterized protein LOC129308117 [Prosopis cineraria]|uniref:uncharacterized protein LOC129308117 n=1 Tax=Prosopis cineraria TaxID=364024 RepID=UPI00240F8913|nr:uncharacterized protein LOC129308117 [Prosopis cineraria]
MGKQQLSLMIIIRQFKVAVKKMKFLLALYRRVHSRVGRGTSSKLLQRWQSFPGRGVMAFHDSESSRGGRKRSYYYGQEEDDEDDINERAESFIANFRHQLRLETQMELTCCSSPRFEDE